jgi:hypothetical protein
VKFIEMYLLMRGDQVTKEEYAKMKTTTLLFPDYACSRKATKGSVPSRSKKKKELRRP